MKETKTFFILVLLILGVSCSSEKKGPPRMTAKQTKKDAKPKSTHPGKVLYMQFCMACHMENGEGVPSLYPPLTQTEYVLGDKKRLIETVLHGMEGPIEVKGEKYNNIMAKLDYLRDEQIADILTYVRSNFGNNAEAVTVSDVRTVRAAGAK
ncbi:MAG: cytochrome c [Cytophagales bacterium]|nr:cytochrome c [Cytophagales bacterium]